MENPSQPSKDLHYLITRIINPILNSIIATLHDNSVVHYKDWGVNIKEYTTPEVMAKFLEDWRNELWHKYYGKNLSEVSEEILYDYMRAINYVYTRLYNQGETFHIGKEIKADLILLGQKIEEYLTGKVEVFSNFMFDVEKSKPLQMEKPQETPKSQASASHLKEEESPDFGVCPRCAAYDGDRSKKKLYQCPHCGEWFCEKHIRPSLVLTFEKYRELWSNHRDLRDFLDEEWHRKDGHPCYPYTQKFWQEYENKQRSLYRKDYSSVKEVVDISNVSFKDIETSKSKEQHPKIPSGMVIFTPVNKYAELSKTGIDGEIYENVKLKVTDSYWEDKNKGRIRINRDLLERLRLNRGDTVGIFGKRLVPAKIYTLSDKDKNPNIIRIDEEIRKNAGIEIGDELVVLIPRTFLWDKLSEKTKEIKVPITPGAWHPRDYVHYDNVIIVVENLEIKEEGSIFVTPTEVYVKTPSFENRVPRVSSVRFEYRNGKRWMIIPEELYLENHSTLKSIPPTRSSNTKHPLPKKEKKQKKSKGKYIAVGVAILLLILVGYLYSQGSFDNIGILIFGKSGYSSQETNTYMPSYTDTQTPSQTYTQTLPITSESYCSNGYWRYIFEDALKCALTEEELSKISNLANQLKGETIQESAWNILEWLDKNIEYDYYKASLPAPIIWKYPDGRIKEVTGGEGKEIQTPYETVQKGEGICVDYAILTAALLLEMNYEPVYVFDINFENSETGHTATAIKINGEYFMLDQHPPVMDLGTYYKYWSVYRQEAQDELLLPIISSIPDSLLISNATVYEIKKSGSGVLVEKVETLSAEDFKQRDYKFSFVDINKISEDLKRVFKEHYPNLILDNNIANLDKRSYLPVGYSDGRIWRMEFPHYVDFYNPVFHKQFVEYLYTTVTDDSEVKYDLQRFNRFWVKPEQEGNSLKVILNLAKK